MKYRNSIYTIALLCCGGTLQAAGGGGGGGGVDTVSADPVIQTAQAAISQKNWTAAQATLLKALSSDSQNADYHNLYAYALRKSANPDMGSVFNHYDEALRLNPKHRGAHEYMGEAYLMTNNLPKAKEHLAALDKLCFFGCEEFSDLKKAIASYEISHPH
jgi:tetratricopeptide (TPR) repeat protein